MFILKSYSKSYENPLVESRGDVEDCDMMLACFWSATEQQALFSILHYRVPSYSSPSLPILRLRILSLGGHDPCG